MYEKNKIQKWQEISIWVYYISCLSSKYLNYNLPILKLILFEFFDDFFEHFISIFWWFFR